MAKKDVALSILSAIHAENHVYQLILPVAMPMISEEYGLTYFSIGLLTAFFSFPFALLQILFGSLSTRMDRKVLLALGLFLSAAAFLLINFTYDIRALAVLLLLAGVGGSTYHPVGIPFISELFPDRLGQSLGFHQAGGAVGSFVAPIAVGAVAALLGWRSAFLTMAVLGFALTILLWISLDAPTRIEAVSTKENINAIRPVLLLILAMTAAFLGLRGLTPFAVKYFEMDKGVTYAEATILFSLLQVAGIFSGPVCGRLSDAFGRKRIIYILVVAEVASLLSITLTQGSPLVLGCLVFGFATFGLLATSDALFADIVPSELLGTVIGFNLTVSFGTSVIIPPLLGGMIDFYGFNYSFIALSAIVPLSIILLMKAKV